MSNRLQGHQLAAMTAHKKLVDRGMAKESDFVMPARIVKKARSSPEWQLQFKLFKWWRGYCRTQSLPECLFFAVPNGAALSGGNAQWQKNERGRKGAMLKMTGLTAGVADCFLSVPKWGDVGSETNEHTEFHGLFLELKSPTGIVSDDQRVFAAAVTAQGYQHVVARTLLEAMDAVQNYIR